MLQERLEQVKARIREACARAHRNPDDVELVLVTKTVTPQRIREAYGLGCRDFGENRVQEFLTKKDELPPDIRWHFVGHLQTNKAKLIAAQVACIESLDRLPLAEALERQAAKRNIIVSALLQVNVSAEPQKHGFDPEHAGEAVYGITRSFPHIRLKGLMTIGPLTDDQRRIRSAFRRLRDLRAEMAKAHPNVELSCLSMGMSSDFKTAIEEGATSIRIGSAVFGARPEVRMS